MKTRAKNWILRPYLVSAHWIEEESTILVMDTFCVLTSVIIYVTGFIVSYIWCCSLRTAVDCPNMLYKWLYYYWFHNNKNFDLNPGNIQVMFVYRNLWTLKHNNIVQGNNKWELSVTHIIPVYGKLVWQDERSYC